MARPAAQRRTAEGQTEPQPTRGAGNLRALPFVGTDEALLRGLKDRQPAAIAAFCDRFSARVLRLLARVLGRDDELPDLHHDVFVRALGSLHKVRDPSKLEGWISVIAVNVARSAITRRMRHRWLRFVPSDELPEPVDSPPAPEHTEALRRTYRVLDQLPPEERIVFALRIIEGMKLTEVEEACGVSLATVKRRLTKAEARFVEMARQDPVLREWLQGGRRWTAR